MTIPGKRIILITGILLGLVFICIGIAILLFPAERIIGLIEDRASQALGMPVSVDDAGLSFAGIPALKVSGITLGPPAGTSEPLATVDALKVRVNLLKLLRHEIEIVSAEIIRPEIHLIQTPPDTTSVVTAGGSAEQAGPPSLPFPLTLSALDIKDGRVQIDQYPEGTVILSNVNQHLSLSLDRELTSLETTGTLAIGDLSLSLPVLTEPLSGFTIEFEHEASGNLSTGTFNLTDGRLMINGIPLSVTGALKDWTTLTSSVTTGDIEATAVLDLIPGSLLPMREKFDADGTFTFSIDAATNLAQQSTPTFSGTFAIERMRLAYEDLPRPVDNISVRASFSESALSLDQLTVETGSSNLRISGSIDSLMGMPAMDLRAAGHLNIPDFTASLPLPNSETLDGQVDIDIALTGNGTDPKAFIPTGNVTLDGFTFSMPEVLNNPASATGSLDLEPERISLSALDIRSGKSDVQFTGTLDSYRNLLDPASGVPAMFTSTLSSSLIDVEDLLVIDKEKEVKVIKPWEMKDAIEAMPVPPNIAAQLDVTMGSIVFGRLSAESAGGTVTLADGVLSCSDLTVNAYQGVLTGNANIDFSTPDNPTYSTAFALKGFESGGFLADLFNRDQFMRGILSTTIALSGAGLDSVSMLDNLTGNGDMQFTNGEIDNWEFTRKLGEHLSFLDFDILAFDTIANRFQVENRRVITPDMRIKNDRVSLTLDGLTEFDGSIEYDITLALDQETSQRAARSINALAELIDGDVGELSLTVKADGSITNPAFSLDTSQAQEQLRERAKQTVQEQVEKLIDERIEDSNLKEEGKKLLDRLLR